MKLRYVAILALVAMTAACGKRRNNDPIQQPLNQNQFGGYPYNQQNFPYQPAWNGTYQPGNQFGWNWNSGYNQNNYYPYNIGCNGFGMYAPQYQNLYSGCGNMQSSNWGYGWNPHYNPAWTQAWGYYITVWNPNAPVFLNTGYNNSIYASLNLNWNWNWNTSFYNSPYLNYGGYAGFNGYAGYSTVRTRFRSSYRTGGYLMSDSTSLAAVARAPLNYSDERQVTRNNLVVGRDTSGKGPESEIKLTQHSFKSLVTSGEGAVSPYIAVPGTWVLVKFGAKSHVVVGGQKISVDDKEKGFCVFAGDKVMSCADGGLIAGQIPAGSEGLPIRLGMRLSPEEAAQLDTKRSEVHFQSRVSRDLK